MQETKQEIEYKTFRIPKRTGGYRTIEQPLGEGMQILKNKLIEIEKIEALKPSYFSHAFMHGRNIVTCAKQHIENDFLMRLDISNFFPSITKKKFRDVLSYSKKRSAFNLSDEDIDNIMEKIDICFKKDEVRGVYYLPQGSPTSPFLSNSYMWLFDWQMAWYCYRNNVVYSRYADDIYISAPEKTEEFMHCVYRINNALKSIGLKEKIPKRKVMKPGKQMNVVGIVINEKINIPKKTRKIIRAIKHNAKMDNKPLTKEQKGLINFQEMVDNCDKDVRTNIEICGRIDMAKKV